MPLKAGFQGLIARVLNRPGTATQTTIAQKVSVRGVKVGLPRDAQADYNKIQVPDLGRKLVSRYGIREKSPVPTLASEVVPVVLVDDLIGESDIITPRIRPAAGMLRLTSAATTSHIHLINPVNSRTILHLFYFYVTGSTTGDVNFRSHADPTNTVNGSTGFRNTLLANQSPVGQVQGQQTAAISGAIIGLGRMNTGIGQLIPFDHVIAQGNVFTVETNLVLTGTLHVFYVWSEESMDR